MTGTRYSIARNILGLWVPSIEGQSLRFCATRHEALGLIEYADDMIGAKAS